MEKHFTATAFIVDSQQRTLLLWHKRLQRWMPPGGHIDPNETPAEAAKRECKEETGLDVVIHGDEQPDVFLDCPNEGQVLCKPFALLLENIPASEERGEPAHQHMDFVYLARPQNEVQKTQLSPNEADDMRWFTAAEIQKLDEQREIFGNVKNYILKKLLSFT